MKGDKLAMAQTRRICSTIWITWGFSASVGEGGWAGSRGSLLGRASGSRRLGRLWLVGPGLARRRLISFLGGMATSPPRRWWPGFLRPTGQVNPQFQPILVSFPRQTGQMSTGIIGCLELNASWWVSAIDKHLVFSFRNLELNCIETSKAG